MHPLLQAVLATLGVGLVSLAGLVFLAFRGKALDTLLFVMVAFAAGALISAALFHLVPEAFEQIGHFAGSISVLVGFSVFFVLERFLWWRHCHEGPCDVHPYSKLSLIGDALHNFLDGMVIGGAFLVSPVLGLSTTAVIAAHELPQELGDFAILVHGGYTRRRALLLNLVTSLTAVLGALVAWTGMSEHLGLVPYLMGFAAGNFLYIGSSDLIPELHKEQDIRKAVVAFLFFLLAVILMAWFAAGAEHAHVH